jgi:magnesium transporter
MISSYLYRKDSQLEVNVPIDRFGQALQDPDALLWVDIEDPEDHDIECLLEIFELHPLTVEDCIMPNQRPKLEEFERYLFFVLLGLRRNEKNKLVYVELDVCLGANFLITVHSEPIRAVHEDRVRVEKKSPVIKRGADFLFYSLVKALIDSYFPVIDEIELKVDELESQLLKDSGPKQTLKELFAIYSELMLLRRTMSPHRDILNRLNSGDLSFIQPSNAIYFRDIYDHLLRMSDLIDGCREVTTMALEAYSTIVSNRLNENMKSMTAMATLAVPLVLITGIYGMNFGENPEIGPRHLYHLASLLLLLSVPAMFVYFRKYRWL